MGKSGKEGSILWFHSKLPIYMGIHMGIYLDIYLGHIPMLFSILCPY